MARVATAPDGAGSDRGNMRRGARRGRAAAGRGSRTRDSGPRCGGRGRRTRGRPSSGRARRDRRRRARTGRPWSGASASAEDLFQPAHGAVPAERRRDEPHARGGEARAERFVHGEALELGGEVGDVAPPRDERGLAVARIVATAAVVVGHHRCSARHRLHRRHPEPFVPRRAQVDLAARVQGGEAVLWRIQVEFVVPNGAARRLDAEPDQSERRDVACHPCDRLEAVGDPLPRVLVVEQEHAGPRGGDVDRCRMEEVEVDRRHEHLGGAAEPLAHEIAEPRRDDDFPERQPIGRVHGVGSAVVEALLVQHYESLYHGASDAVDTTYRLPLRKIVISTWLRDLMRERFGSPAEVLVTPVDLDLFHPTPVDVSTSRPRVLMLHHEHAWKGVADGFEAVARVTRHVPTLRLVGFGVKPPRGAVRYDEFHLNPPQDRLAALYSGCEIYLCPSWDEGLGMPPMEAMACGAAVVTYDNGGCRDYARDGETALVARRRDIADLAAKLERLAVDESLRARLAAAGMRFVTTAFSWDRAVRRLEEIFG